MKSKYDKEILEKLFTYDESSPSCLISNVEKQFGPRAGKWLGNPVGSIVRPSPTSKECWVTRAAGISVQVARVVYVLHGGSVENKITFLDEDSLNCKIENIVAVEDIINKNIPSCKTNTGWRAINLSGGRFIVGNTDKGILSIPIRRDYERALEVALAAQRGEDISFWEEEVLSTKKGNMPKGITIQTPKKGKGSEIISAKYSSKKAGRILTKAFSIQLHGFEEAKNMATEQLRVWKEEDAVFINFNKENK